MAKVKYNWADGVELKEHTQCKLDVLREYFAQYLRVKCFPRSPRFRIVIVDGFAGGGIYKDGTSGSPLIFLEELGKFAQENNLWRSDQGLPELSIECLFIVNEIDPEANESLDKQFKIWKTVNNQSNKQLKVQIERLREDFTEAYSQIEQFISAGKFQNVLFNIDQCGYSHVSPVLLQNIMKSFKSVEIFYTFMIGALFQYFPWKDFPKIEKTIEGLGFPTEAFLQDEALRTKSEWLGGVEKIIHSEFSKIADYVAPFAINQEGAGYNYWLLHFSNHSRAREVYNNVLHEKTGSQVHFGRFGLDMLKYTPGQEGVDLFNFSDKARDKSKLALHSDIPEVISEHIDGISVNDFKAKIYNDTPAHSDDIKDVLIKNSDIEVFTGNTGDGKRSKPNSIVNTDIIRLKKQKSFHFLSSKK